MRRVNLYITLVLVAILVIYLAFLDTLAKPIFESQASELYGAEVSVESLQLSPFVGKVTLHQLQVADRRNAMKNLAQADRVYVDIDMIKLASDIIEIDDMEIDGLTMFAPRNTPATILRPLLPEDSDIATASLPTFELPDVDSLVEQQRDQLERDIATLKQSFNDKQAKWEEKIASLPNKADIDSYKARIKQLKKADGVAGRLAALREVQKIYSEVNRDISNMRSMQQEFRGDIQTMREQVDVATQLPQKHVNELVSSLGLSSSQLAQLGSLMLRGDLDGLTEQVLAPLAYSADGAIDSEETMPIFIRRAQVSGSLLPSASSLSTSGTLENFAWPLESADQPAQLQLSGSSADGGALKIYATVDHRGAPADKVSVQIDQLPLRNMQLAGVEGLNLQLLQTLANVSGNLSVDGDALAGEFTQQFTKTLFKTSLEENAGAAARLVAAVLEGSTDYLMEISFAGTLQSPELSFRSDLDQIIESTLRGAISAEVGELTQDLQNRISAEIGPEIAAARGQFQALEKLQTQLRGNLNELDSLKP